VTALDLTGLKAHHPLGFLAACGTLVCCERNDSVAQLAWTQICNDTSWIAQLVLDSDEANLIHLLVTRARCVTIARALSWADGKKKTDRKIQKQTPERFRKYAKQTHLRSDLDDFSALSSDLAVTDKGTLQPTLLDMTSASQGFLDEIKDLAQTLETTTSKPSKIPTPDDAFREALFGPWQYRDGQHSLGWDPDAQRLHAVRGMAPTNDTERRSVRAAVFLASQALPLFPCFSVGGRLHTVGFHRDGDDDWFSWPIWREPITLDTLRSLLAHPFSSDLRERGVEVVYRCRRAHTGGSEGNYQIFSHAEERPWPGRPRRRRSRQPVDQ
jgi:hypothetical protein